ncbi:MULTISPECIES: hypothetical protein [Empedobacter]|uniref:Uncharacterized protein n=1 Tax=Empedobacter falsenii TaxID=343874 RepID=A0A7H9DN84_9FLAO|nr:MULTISPECIES: hypothetical protein [Empedobacter]MDH2207262.1 hypothetical protein [Empedobacter sp. GD03644]QLL56607.1 hypothetical protein FH779_00180 [Empedobacter falsenii]
MNHFLRYRNLGSLFLLLFSSILFGYQKDTIVESGQILIFISKNTETNLLEKITVDKTINKTTVEKKTITKPKKLKKVLVVKKENKQQKEHVYKPKTAILSSKIKFLSGCNLPENSGKIVLKENFYKYHQKVARTNSIFKINLSDIANNLLAINNSFIHIRINVIDNILTRPPPFSFTKNKPSTKSTVLILII